MQPAWLRRNLVGSGRVLRPGRDRGCQRRPGTLVLLQRAHPDIFEDALRAVIDKAKQREP